MQDASIALRPDLSPRRHASLEWWFAEGRVAGPGAAPVDFMISVFRQGGGKSGGDGFMLLVSSFDHASGRHSVRSEVTDRLVGHFLEEAPGELQRIGVDAQIASAFLGEIRVDGAPLPVRASTKPVVLAGDRLAIQWGDVTFAAAAGGIEIAFDLPGGGERLQLTAREQAAWLDAESIGAAGRNDGMAYQSCPRLGLVGTIGREPVEGEGWIDHQFGDYGWLRANGDDARILGWNWFAVNLADRRDLMVMVRRDMKSGEPVSSFAVWFDGVRPPEIVEDVRLSPKRVWVSPRSMVAYPLEWLIEIPSLALTLDFRPLADNQEIPVFGLLNAIWEGVGSVAGRIAGRPVTGRARLELNGYGFVLDSDAQQKRWVERIDRTLAAFLPARLTEERLVAYAGTARWRYDADAQTAMLSQPVWDLLSRGGKHWRPIYGMLLLEAFGIDPAPYETLVSIVPELVHNGSVIIDDIEDRSEIRRSEPTIHRRYGIPAAINAGNMLYFLPLLELAGHPALDVRQRDEIYGVIMRMFVRGHLGQAQDLHMSGTEVPRDAGFWLRPELGQHILQTHAFKTAAAVAAISEVVAIVAHASEPVRNASLRFGESWGVAFQIVDDVNNLATGPGWGKVRGEDIAAGKASYAIWKAVTMLGGAERDRLIAILDNPGLRVSGAGLDEAIALIEHCGALQACRDEARALVEADWPAFRDALPHSQARIMLRLFVSNLIGIAMEL